MKVLVGTVSEVGTVYRDQGHGMSGCESAATAMLRVVLKSV